MMRPTRQTTDSIDELGVDRVLERLREVVAQLEAGQLSLEQSLAMYEQGVALARRGHQVLDGAEKRVEQLVRKSAHGHSDHASARGRSSHSSEADEVETIPFDHGDPDAHGSGEQSE